MHSKLGQLLCENAHTVRCGGCPGSHTVVVQGNIRKILEGEQHMATQGYETVQRNPKYQQLVKERLSFGWTLSVIMLTTYFGFILMIAYAPKFLGIPIGTGVMTIGIPIGLFVIVSAFVLVGIYVRRANAVYDSLISDIVDEAR